MSERIFCQLGWEEGKNVLCQRKMNLLREEGDQQEYNLKQQKDRSKFKKLLKDPKDQKIVELLTDGKGEWHSTKNNPFESKARGPLTEEAKVWFFFLGSVLLPSNHLSTV